MAPGRNDSDFFFVEPSTDQLLPPEFRNGDYKKVPGQIVSQGMVKGLEGFPVSFGIYQKLGVGDLPE